MRNTLAATVRSSVSNIAAALPFTAVFVYLEAFKSVLVNVGSLSNAVTAKISFLHRIVSDLLVGIYS